MARSIIAGGLPVLFPSGDEETADVVASAVEATLALAARDWHLAPPRDCRLHVMTSWRSFFFQAAPGPWRVPLAVSYPLWAARARQTWPISAGWTLRFGRRIAIGIKPPRLLEVSDRSVGARMFTEEPNPVAKVRHVACHELIHAASSHLRLPPWLNEGLAAVSVDRFMGRSTIRTDSLDLVQSMRPKARPPSYRSMARLKGEVLAYHALRGYWIVRLLEEAHPGFVRGLLTARQPHAAIERQVADRLSLPPDDLWRDIDEFVFEWFQSRSLTTP